MALIAFALSLIFFASPALAQDVSSHIVNMRISAEMPGATTAAIVLWCRPMESELGQKFGYLDLDHETEAVRLLAALRPRSDVGNLIFMDNPTTAEVSAWFAAEQEALGGEKYREMLIAVACPATGGDTDEERLMTREIDDAATGGLDLYILATSINEISSSSFWLMDTSRDLSAAVEPGITTFGPTADDIARLGVSDAFAVSTGGSGRYAKGGLLSAAADVIMASNGASLTLDQFYTHGLKAKVPELDLATSAGLTSNDAWGGNGSRLVFIGGPLIVDVPINTTLPPTLPKTPSRFKPAHGVIAGGGALLIGGGVFSAMAAGDYKSLNDYNRLGGESQEELSTTVAAYHRNTALGVSLGTVGLAAIGVGTAWAVLDNNHRITVMPTGNGVAVTRSF